MKKTLILSTLMLPLAGCQWIGNTADSLGEHLPTIGERCEHWQCMTQSGQARSDEIKAEQENQTKSGPEKPSVPSTEPAPASPPPN